MEGHDHSVSNKVTINTWDTTRDTADENILSSPPVSAPKLPKFNFSRDGAERGIDVDMEGGQPIPASAPPEVDRALYQIEFVRKLYGAHVDVLNTLDDIGFVDSYSRRRHPTLNIAYLALWRRGNAPTAGEKVVPDKTIADTTYIFPESLQNLFKIENSPFINNATLYDQSWTFNTSPSSLNMDIFKSGADISKLPVWTVRAPDATAGEAQKAGGSGTAAAATATSASLTAPAIKVNPPTTFPTTGFDPSSFNNIDLSTLVFTEGFSEALWGPLSDPVSSFDYEDFFITKPKIKESRTELINKAKQQLEEEKQKEEPDSSVLLYLEEKIKVLESATDEQFDAGLELPDDPRAPEDEDIFSDSTPVRSGDVGWTNPNVSIWDRSVKTEKIEGIWQFLFNPETLERSFGPQYKFANSWGNTEGQAPHWTGNKNQELRFRDIKLNGFVFGKKVESLVKGLEALVDVEKDSGQQSPPVLEFVWGKKVFGPCIMEDISVNEQKWDGGELVDASLSFTLKQIPEWIVNDEYINIFDPTGQPLQQIVVQPEKPAETTAETPAADDTAGDSAPAASETKIKVNSKSLTCAEAKNIMSAYDSAVSAFLKDLYTYASNQSNRQPGIMGGKMNQHLSKLNSTVTTLGANKKSVIVANAFKTNQFKGISPAGLKERSNEVIMNRVSTLVKKLQVATINQTKSAIAGLNNYKCEASAEKLIKSLENKVIGATTRESPGITESKATNESRCSAWGIKVGNANTLNGRRDSMIVENSNNVYFTKLPNTKDSDFRSKVMPKSLTYSSANTLMSAINTLLSDSNFIPNSEYTKWLNGQQPNLRGDWFGGVTSALSLNHKHVPNTRSIYEYKYISRKIGRTGGENKVHLRREIVTKCSMSSISSAATINYVDPGQIFACVDNGLKLINAVYAGKCSR